MNDYITKMPPKRKYQIKVRISKIKKAKPKVNIDALRYIFLED